MEHNMDQRTLAYINLYAILGTLENLCSLSAEAREILGEESISVGITVAGGPAATLRFGGGTCILEEGAGRCDIRLPFGTPDRFNGMINGTATPIPSKGFTKIKFLLGTFTRLTDLLSLYLKPKPEDLEDEEFFNISTALMFHVIVSAAAQVGNHDKIGRFSAGYICDGNIRLAIAGGPGAYLSARQHLLTAVHKEPETVMSSMEFGDMHTARDLFEGNDSSFSLICAGKVTLKGMIAQLDNVNRILDRVGLYLG